MIYYAFDLHPRLDPSGARLVRFSKLQAASYKAEANGTGRGSFSIRATDAEAAFIDPAGLQYVRVVEINDAVVDGATLSGFGETVRGGFFLESGTYEVLTETSTKLLTWGGLGALSYYGRAVMDADSWINDPFIGTDPQPDGTWPLHLAGTGNELGAILWRILHELEEPGRHQNPVPLMTLGFTYLVDSNAAAWVRTTGDFVAQVGDNVLDIIRRLMQMGLYVEVDSDTFEVNAYEPETHRRDRTGVAWGASVVRLQSPTDATVPTGNIKSDAFRQLEAKVSRNAELLGANDTWLWVTDPAVDVLWEGSFRVDDEAGTSLLKVGEARLGARSDAGDVLRARIKLGDDPSNGRYVPFDHIRLDDLVTVGTGTGTWDYDEADFPVAAIALELRPGGDWDAWAELGSTFLSPNQRAFQAQPVGAHTHPPNPKICRDTGTILRETYTRTETGEAGTSEFGPEWEEAVQNDPLLISVDGSSLVVIGPDPSDFMDHGVPLSLAFPINLTWRWFRDGTLTGTPRMEIQLANGFPTETDEYSLTLFGTLFGAALGNAGETDSDSDTVTVTAGAWYRGHALLTATEVKASFWEDGDPEPGAWMRTATLPTTTMAVPTHLWTRMWPSAAGQTLKVDDIVINSFSTCIHGGPDANSGDGTQACGKCVAAGNHEHDYVATGGTAGQVLKKASGDDWDTEWVAETAGAPTTADYLVGTAQAGLSAEIVVGTTPGGELGNTWASPTVDATHAGSNHLQPVRKNSAGTVFERRRLNLIEGSNVTLTVADDAGNDEVDVTIAATGGGSLTVEDEGTPLTTAADTLDFVGAGVVASGAGTTKTITISGASVADILDLPTAETDDTLVLAPDGAGGVEFRAEAGGSGDGRIISRTQSVLQDECLLGTSTGAYGGMCFVSFSGTGASFSALAGELGHPGIVSLNPGTQNGVGRCSLTSAVHYTAIRLDDAVVRFGVIFRIPTLSDGTDRFTVRLGLGDSHTAEPVDGVYFRYVDNVNGGQWEGVCRQNDTETVLDTNITADTAFHVYEAEVNVDATSVEYFIDGTSVGTVTTNIPTGAGRETGLMPAAIIKALGTTSRPCHLDAYWYHFDFTPSR